MPGEVVGPMEFPGGRRFEVAVHDLLREETDAIVNAANGRLSHGGGVAAAIARAAGPSLVREGDELVRRQGDVPTGQAVVTTAGDLPFEGVIHAVGPRMGEGDEEDKVAHALDAAFLRAHERGWRSVSFPGISSGIFAVPHDVCARAYFRAVKEFWARHGDSSVRLIRLVLFEGPLLDEVSALLET
ncbi:MAG: macro domain-containing protein [bacterium]|nr:MAG: macro domain-containing protein [bacterium]